MFSRIFEPSRGSQVRRFKKPMARLIFEKYEPLKIKASIKFTSGPAKAQTASFEKLRVFEFFLSILMPKGVNTISLGVSLNKNNAER